LSISLIGLPVNVRQTKTWTTGKGRVFALLPPDLRVVGSQTDVRRARQTGRIAALVLNKPGGPPKTSRWVGISAWNSINVSC
jgi:hypothetical protein